MNDKIKLHGDFDCCCICDKEMKPLHVLKPLPKVYMCKECFEHLRKFGLNIGNSAQLVNWIESADREEVIKVLKDRYMRCCYSNDVDDALIRKGVKFVDNRILSPKLYDDSICQLLKN
jgi:hypothetical protein